MGHAVFQQRSNILGVAVISECGVITTTQIVGIAQLAEKFQIAGMKLTTRQTLLFLIKSEHLALFKVAIEEIGLSIGVFGNVVRNVKGCSGREDLCKYSLGDAYGLGLEIQKIFMNQPTPKDFKISTAGCFRACTDPYCADFGIIAVDRDAFNVYIGGCGGSKKPRHGTLIAERASAEDVMEILDCILVKYRDIAEINERLCDTIERLGIDEFQRLAML